MKGFAKFILTATAAAAGGTVTARPSAVARVSYSLAMNSEPRTGTRVSWLRPGERVAIECQVQGDWVDGRWGARTCGIASRAVATSPTGGSTPARTAR